MTQKSLFEVTVEMADVPHGKTRTDDFTDDEQKVFFEEDEDELSFLNEKEEEEDSEGYEHKKLTLAQACGLNTMNMFGTGPFITIPFVVAAADPPGPQALIGYALAAFACMNDSLVWSEIGSMWPDSGGSYVYLREMYGPHTYGRLMAFLFVWQIMVSGPMECASGFIATAQYIAYIDKDYSYWHHSGIAFAMCVGKILNLCLIGLFFNKIIFCS
jgi:amino acid transporter